MNISFRPQPSIIKKNSKNNLDNQYETYLNNRDNNRDNNNIDNNNNINENNNDINNKQNKENYKQNKEKNDEYKKEEFLEEFQSLHNDIYFNPYKILDIDKEYTPDTLKEKYKELALIYHPDKGGDPDIFCDVTKSYIYLLKKYKEKIPDKQIFELKNDFDEHIKNESNKKNILMKNDRFDINEFNNVFDNYQIKQNNGYEDFMKDTEKPKKDTYIFSEKFNIKIFNKLFDKNIKKEIKQQKIQLYKEPETLFQSNSNYSELGEENIDDYTSGFNFNKSMHYTDCKIAYSEPESLDCSIETFGSLEELEKHRKNISYKMNDDDNSKYNHYLEYTKNKEYNRLKRLEKQDINILKQYNKINNLLLE